MLTIIHKVIKNPKIIYRILESNLQRRAWFPIFYKKRNEIKNWFYLYLYCSSFFIDCLLILFGKKAWVRRLKVAAYYSNGLSFYFPMATSRYYGMFTDLMADLYMRDFEKYFSKKMHFQKDDVVIDIGAHVGKFCIPIFMNYPCVRVFAFEPDPSNYSCLRKNLEVNNIDQLSFKAEPFAVYNKSGEIVFSRGNFSSQGSVAGTGFFLENKKNIQVDVKVTTLDNIFRQYQIKKCKLLKIDCEGSEYGILENLSDETLMKVENLFIEIHPVQGKNPLALKKFLINKDFDVKGHLCSEGCYEFFCVRHSRNLTSPL